jgi:hypothetical protein
MDDLYWKQAFGNKENLLQSINDEATRDFAEINYGPWSVLMAISPLSTVTARNRWVLSFTL